MTPLEDFSQGGAVTRERAEKATEWLVHHAVQIGEARAAKDGTYERLKIAKARAMLRSDAKTNAMQEAEALSSPEYDQAVADYMEASRAYHILDATQKAAEILIDVWRSINSATKGAA
jgi:hypothetical protein